MLEPAKVILSQSLETADIRTDGTFDVKHVLDLRCTSGGAGRPIEETVLRRLKNHFVNYNQTPLAAGEAGPCQEIHLCETINEFSGKVMVLTDDVSYVASLLGIFKIPFESRVFYVVETGKGDIVKPVATPDRMVEEVSAVAV